jgi:hypothetical protein
VVVAPGADRSLANGHEPQARTGFPGLFDDGYTGVAGGIRLGRNGREAGAAKDDPDARDFAGGIVRFSLGGGGK